MIIVQQTGTLEPRPPQSPNLVRVNLLCPVLDVDHLSSSVIKRNHVYVALF